MNGSLFKRFKLLTKSFWFICVSKNNNSEQNETATSKLVFTTIEQNLKKNTIISY